MRVCDEISTPNPLPRLCRQGRKMDEDRSAPTTLFLPKDPTAMLPVIALWPRARLGVSATLKKLEEIDTGAQTFVADVVIQLRLLDDRPPDSTPALVHPEQVRLFSVVEIENAVEVFSKELWTDFDCSYRSGGWVGGW
jgi:hypothetical protein